MELLGNGPLEGEEFLFVGMIPLLGVIHNSTRISVRLEEERFIEVRKSQNGA